MTDYIVLYRIESWQRAADPPFAFRCQADDTDHAEEQCENAYPDCDVVWIYNGTDPQDALCDYWWAGDTKEVTQ